MRPAPSPMRSPIATVVEHPSPDGGDNSRGLDAEDGGRRRRGIEAGAIIDVDEIHADGGLSDPNLAGSGIGDRDLGDLERFRPARFSHQHDTRHFIPLQMTGSLNLPRVHDELNSPYAHPIGEKTHNVRLGRSAAFWDSGPRGIVVGRSAPAEGRPCHRRPAGGRPRGVPFLEAGRPPPARLCADRRWRAGRDFRRANGRASPRARPRCARRAARSCRRSDHQRPARARQRAHCAPIASAARTPSRYPYSSDGGKARRVAFSPRGRSGRPPQPSDGEKADRPQDRRLCFRALRIAGLSVATPRRGLGVHRL